MLTTNNFLPVEKTNGAFFDMIGSCSFGIYSIKGGTYSTGGYYSANFSPWIGDYTI